MPIYPVRGDVVIEGPRRAQALALWLRGGYNQYDMAWRALVELYGKSMGQAFHDGEGRVSQQPWKAGHDLFDILGKVEGQQRYLYLFANPRQGNDHGVAGHLLAKAGVDPMDDLEIQTDDSDCGYPDLATLQGDVTDCLNCLAEKKITSVAMIFIPLAANHDLRGEEKRTANHAVARAMEQTIKDWEAAHPSHEMTMYLFDRCGGFGRVVHSLETERT